MCLQVHGSVWLQVHGSVWLQVHGSVWLQVHASVWLQVHASASSPRLLPCPQHSRQPPGHCAQGKGWWGGRERERDSERERLGERERCIVYLCQFHIEGSGPEWYISSMLYTGSRDIYYSGREPLICLTLFWSSLLRKDGQTDRQMDGQTDIQTDTQTDTQTGRGVPERGIYFLQPITVAAHLCSLRNFMLQSKWFQPQNKLKMNMILAVF